MEPDEVGMKVFLCLFFFKVPRARTDWLKQSKRGLSSRRIVSVAWHDSDGFCDTGSRWVCDWFLRWVSTVAADARRRNGPSPAPFWEAVASNLDIRSPPTSFAVPYLQFTGSPTSSHCDSRPTIVATRPTDRPRECHRKKKNNSFRPPPHRLSPPLDARNVVHRLRLFLSLSPFSVAPFFVFSFSFTKSKRFLRRSRTSFRSGSLHSASPLMDSSNRISTDDVTIPTTPQWPFIQFNFRFDDKKRTPMFFFHFWWRWSIFHIKSFEPISITKFLLKKNISFITASELHWILWRSYWVCLPKLRLSTTFWKKNVIPHFVIIF